MNIHTKYCKPRLMHMRQVFVITITDGELGLQIHKISQVADKNLLEFDSYITFLNTVFNITLALISDFIDQNSTCK